MKRLYHYRWIAALLVLAAVSMARAANPKPFVIPELRQWKGGEGSLELPASARIVATSDSLESVARQLSDDYAVMFGRRIPVVSGKGDKGDIVLSVKADRNLGSEGYTVRISDRVAVSAPRVAGVYWATRTLLQMSESSRALPKGTVTDWPDYGLRGFSLDVARKAFPMSYLDDLVKIMSYYKMNSLRVHLNDNGPLRFSPDGTWERAYSAFRLECDTYPGLTARDCYYTKADFVRFQHDAASRYVTIVPEIDVPAHSLAFTHYRPDLASKEYGTDHLDLFNPEVIPFIDALFAEYIGGDDPVFVGPYVHIGTDEFGAESPDYARHQAAVEKFRSFTDHYLGLVKSYGKHPWVWGALSKARGETPIDTEGVYLDAWSNGFADPAEMVSLGFKINSVPDGFVYIVPLAPYYHDYLDLEFLYDKWTPAHVRDVVFPERDPAILGGYFAEWNDNVGNGISVKDVHHRVFPALQVVAAKLWDGVSVTLPYADFDAARRLMSEAPGVNQMATFRGGPRQVYATGRITPGMATGLTEIGYDYTVEFELEARKEDPGTVLFSSPSATFYLADPVKGMLGFSRDGYLNTFRYAPYPGEKVKVRIEGDHLGTSLWINDSLVDNLDIETRWYNGGQTPQKYIRTLVFPLQQAGDFRSGISDLRVYNYRTSVN